jgi:diguanylate cyclase (GGDEF)-like protein
MRGVGIMAWTLLSFGPPAARGAEVLSAPARTAHLAIEPAAPGRRPWVVFDERSGLPQHTIVDMMADPSGFVWAATQDGAARYDGRTWETVSLPRGMRTNYPRAMRAAKDGGIWFGSFDGGLAHLRDDTWTITDETSGLPSNRIRGLLETTDGRAATALWIATEKGVARLQDGRLTTFGEGSGLPSLDTEGLSETVEANGERTLLVGTTQGLARFAGDRFVPVPVPRQMLGHRIGDIVESAGLGGGRALWITSYGGGMAVRENGAWTVLDTTSGLPSNVEVITKSEAKDGSPALWIGTEGGLLRFEHGRFTLYDERSGLPIRIIWKVLETTSPGGLKTLWLGTWGGGIVRLSENAWTSFDTTTGMPSGSVTSVLASRGDGGGETIWAGTSDGGLARFENGRFRAVELPRPLRHAIVFSLLETKDADGGRSLWLGSFGGGLGRLKGGRWTVHDLELLPNERVYTVRETKADDGSSVLWVGTEGGLGRLQRGKWTFFRKGVELPSEVVTQVLETRRADGTRTVWVATSHGIARLEGGRWSVVSKDAGLLSENVVALELTADADGTKWIWAGTFAGGASRVRLEDPSGAWETFATSTSPALPSDTVMGVAQDQKHRIYLTTTRGVARLSPRAPTPDDPARFSLDLFTTEDGLPSGDCQQAARLVDEQGRVWVGTARGLGMFDPRGEVPDRSPKPLVIEAARLSNPSRKLRGGESLSHTEQNLSFQYALLAYGGESRIRYRYQLFGFDAQPSDWTASPSKEYTNLGAGEYVFRVWGKDARGNVSGPVALAFRIWPAPWETTWAFGAYALAALATAYGGLQWRVRVLSRRAKQLEAMVAERTMELAASRDQLEQLASVDALTELANRRRFDATLEQEWKRAERGGHWLSLVLLDVDFFKRFNDRYGHTRGDACLRAVAQAVAVRCRRPGDLVARYGGEEFALVLPETDPAGVRALLGAVLAGVDALQIEHAGSGCASHVTVSLGAVTLKPAPGALCLSLIERADRLLYQAKEAGRHQAMHEDGSGVTRRVGPDA